MVKRFSLVCLRCGHMWKSAGKNPTVCSKCHSPYWDQPRKATGKFWNVSVVFANGEKVVGVCENLVLYLKELDADHNGIGLIVVNARKGRDI